MIIFSVSKPHLTSPRPDFYELRLDLRRLWHKIPKFFFNHPTIITLRDECEGGNYGGSIAQKLDLFAKLLEETSLYIDIELTHLLKLIDKLNNKALLQKSVVSVHDLAEFDLARARTVIQRAEAVTNCFFLKFVFCIDTFAQLHAVVGLLCNIKVPYALLSTGKLSLITRILYLHLGGVATYYGKKGEITAPNQIDQLDVRTYNLVHINRETRIGGVVGGNQVKHSLGIDFYNTYFRLHRINAVYLPFAIEDCTDFVYFVKNSQLPFFGFSVTMPFKQEITKYINTTDHMINLWLPGSGKTFNTDIHALLYAFRHLNITPQTRIVLLGRGAMAQLVRQLLPEKPAETTNDVCLINATPLGHNGEDVFEYFQIPPFNTAIDLPYAQADTKLVAYCKELGLKYIDGKTFWRIQAKEQLKWFLQGETTAGRLAIMP